MNRVLGGMVSASFSETLNPPSRFYFPEIPLTVDSLVNFIVLSMVSLFLCIDSDSASLSDQSVLID